MKFENIRDKMKVLPQNRVDWRPYQTNQDTDDWKRGLY